MLSPYPYPDIKPQWLQQQVELTVDHAGEYVDTKNTDLTSTYEPYLCDTSLLPTIWMTDNVYFSGLLCP